MFADETEPILPHLEIEDTTRRNFDLAGWRAHEPTEALKFRELYERIQRELPTYTLDQLHAALAQLDHEITIFETGFLVVTNPEIARFLNASGAIARLRPEYLGPRNPDGRPRAADVRANLQQRITEVQTNTTQEQFREIVRLLPFLTEIQDEIALPTPPEPGSARALALRRNIASAQAFLQPIIARGDALANLFTQMMAEAERRAKGTEDPETIIKRQSVERFFRERVVLPLRNEGEPFHTYLQRLHVAIVAHVYHNTVFNKRRDQSAAPYTEDLKANPTRGPLKEINILSHPQSYAGVQTGADRVKDLGSLWDNFSAYFEDPAEQAEAARFAERQKKLLAEATIWHNRAVTRKKYYDSKGPDGALKTYEEYFKSGTQPELQPLFPSPEMTPTERAFARATQFCFAVWSAKTLKAHERAALEPYISARVKKFLVKKYDVIPFYRSTDQERLILVEDMVKEAEEIIQETEGIAVADRGKDESRRQYAAELAYAISESFRIASGLEMEMDQDYRPDGVVKVKAQEGEPKALIIGPYIDSANSTEARPTFNEVFARYLVHGYPTWPRAVQLTHHIPARDGSGRVFDPSGYGDNRLSLTEILSIDGGIEQVDWNTRSSNPDQIIYYMISQAVPIIWARASVTGSLKPENRFFFDPAKIPLQLTQIMDRVDEKDAVRRYFGYDGRFMQNLVRVQKRIPGSPQIEDFETIGFHSPSAPLSGNDAEHVKALYKDFRDYWITAILSDKGRYPYDTVRLLRYMFSRNDRPATDGYVNPKIQAIVEQAHDPHPVDADGRALSPEGVVTRIMKQVEGYVTYDVLLRAVFALMEPSLENAAVHADLTDEHALEHAYEEMTAHNFHEYAVKTQANTNPLNIAQVMWLVNQTLLLRDLLPGEKESLVKAGYKLYPDSPPDPHHPDNPFNRNDVLRLAQEFNLARGYKYVRAMTRDNVPFAQLQRIPGHHVTAQYVMDRLALLHSVFHKDSH